MPLVSLLGRIAAFLSVALCCVVSLDADSAINGLFTNRITCDFRPIGLRQFDSGNVKFLDASSELLYPTRQPLTLKRPISIPIVEVACEPVIEDVVQQLATCPQEACYVNDNLSQPSLGIRHWDAIIHLDSESIQPELLDDILPLEEESTKAINLEDVPFSALHLANLASKHVKGMLPIESIAIAEFKRALIPAHDGPRPWLATLGIDQLVQSGHVESERLASAIANRPDEYWEYYQDCDHWNVRFSSRDDFKIGITAAEKPAANEMAPDSKTIARLMNRAIRMPIIQTPIIWFGQAKYSINDRISQNWVNQALTVFARHFQTQTADLRESPDLHRANRELIPASNQFQR